MKIYLENKVFFVEGEGRKYYKVASINMWDGYLWASVILEPLCGVAADGSLYTVTEENEDEFESSITWYMLEESMKEALTENDFEVLDVLPKEVEEYMRGYL